VKEAAMDWNTNTFFDGPDASGDWVGLDLGSSLKATIVSDRLLSTPRQRQLKFFKQDGGRNFSGRERSRTSATPLNYSPSTTRRRKATITLQSVTNHHGLPLCALCVRPRTDFAMSPSWKFFQTPGTDAPNTDLVRGD
jgi:hypothetical protein